MEDQAGYYSNMVGEKMTLGGELTSDQQVSKTESGSGDNGKYCQGGVLVVPVELVGLFMLDSFTAGSPTLPEGPSAPPATGTLCGDQLPHDALPRIGRLFTGTEVTESAKHLWEQAPETVESRDRIAACAHVCRAVYHFASPRSQRLTVVGCECVGATDAPEAQAPQAERLNLGRHAPMIPQERVTERAVEERLSSGKLSGKLFDIGLANAHSIGLPSGINYVGLLDGCSCGLKSPHEGFLTDAVLRTHTRLNASVGIEDIVLPAVAAVAAREDEANNVYIRSIASVIDDGEYCGVDFTRFWASPCPVELKPNLDPPAVAQDVPHECGRCDHGSIESSPTCCIHSRRHYTRGSGLIGTESVLVRLVDCAENGLTERAEQNDAPVPSRFSQSRGVAGACQGDGSEAAKEKR